MENGALQRAAFAVMGGAALRDWIDACPNQQKAALTFMGGAVWRKRLMEDLGQVSALIDQRSDSDLAALMASLGDNCMQTMAEAFAAITHCRPTCCLVHTIKGWGTPISGQKDNHGGLMNPTQFAAWQQHIGVAQGQEWEPLAAITDAPALRGFLDRVPFFAKVRRRFHEARLPVPAIAIDTERVISTQAAFGKILEDLSKGNSTLAARIVTTSPDVTRTTNLAPGSTAASRKPMPLSNTASLRLRNRNSPL